ncbi:MAG TPA: hypothetical protein VF789_18070 [Thermoanaerobaculia bacterium]
MRVPVLSLALLLFAGSGAYAKGPAGPVRVPQDSRTLDAAIAKVTDGGVIELAAGTYRPTGDGFAIANLRKGFTVRAAAGATVILDGGGARTLLRFVNSRRDRGKRVTFERITFQNGFSTKPNQAGAVTLSQADAVFRDCAFVSNRAAGTGTGGGAVKALEGSSATFVNCSFRENSSPNRGGALSVRPSAEVTVQGGEFVGNRTNVPGHKTNAAGGAIWVLDGRLRVTGARFQGNQAGYVAGAIYALGTWNKGADVLIANSTFFENQALADPCCAHPDPTTGGALHAEDLTTMRIHRSLFVRNRATAGGAVGNFRAITEIYGSVFQGNQSLAGGPQGVGGAIGLWSVDSDDPSTNFGAVNRRSARLVLAHSFLQGGGVERASFSGGCVLAGGDGHRVYGDGPVAVAGTLEENRARVEIRHTVFSDCDIETASDGSGGLGGAVSGDLVDLLMEDSTVLDSDARGSNAGGGAVALRQESNARIVRVTFARNSGQRWGGALFFSGSTAMVDDSRFYGNSAGESRGAAIYTIPFTNAARPRNARGVVSNSFFSDNVGVPVWDIDPASGPINEMRYDGNRFDANGSVYVNTLAASGGVDVSGLNFLTVFRPGRGDTRKSEIPNNRVFGSREGTLRAVPAPSSVGAAATAPNTSLLAYAWTGGSAAIGAQGLSARAGLLEAPPGDYALSVDGSAAAQVRASGSCTAGPFLCLGGNRFRAEVTWKNGAVAAPAQAVSVSGSTGYFWFLGAQNVELMVKVLDGRAVNGSFWVYYGGLTNLEYTLTVTDMATGAVKTYANPAGRFASAGDLAAFPAPARARARLASVEEDLAAACDACGKALPLVNGRFSLDLTWKDSSGQTRTAQAVPLTSDTGYFWFTSAENTEVVVKVLDGRGLNGHFWVYFAGLTDLEYTLTVRDTVTNRSKTYRNLKGRFASQGDVTALPGS